ncbi:zinc/cadmium resistance protein, putative [Entamoeba invadens IP1]|uniref:Zinc/cadmium resistance protein, putative n=1 Tax=Entamoeba invadens IP1 TaxID=370355 RepID=A0A0A1TX54_ENTIV|nr:zinc/cadmium resistance protein, putative [Entamoeba invadens IP1]ELP85885.1 zinc/cadmium resistance protein, putative [Entamoeba invadens IP1]|eukprot:XP_004185231.1 zinc/cadmium resistance protein, putative [Entamoeba invadens IP1]
METSVVQTFGDDDKKNDDISSTSEEGVVNEVVELKGFSEETKNAINHPNSDVWYKDKNVYKLSFLLLVNLLFFLCELITGIVIHSLALLADAFHMLSDLMSQVIGLVAILLAKKKASSKLTYGFVRSEVIGAMVNGIFLLSVGFFIFIEAIQRFIDIEEITDPKVMLIVAAIGLFINLAAMLLFHDHHHHGHSHGEKHSHSEKKSKKAEEKEMKVDIDNYQKVGATDKPVQVDIDSSHIESATIKEDDHSHSHDDHDHEHDHGHNEKEHHGHGSLNMRGVFLHVMGDALGSIVAVAVALCVWFIDGDWKYYLDPALSLIVACVVMSSGVPLVISCIKILMQRIPQGISMKKLKRDILAVDGVDSIHEVHLWQLANETNVATIHLFLNEVDRFRVMEIIQEVKNVFHEHGVHSTTIQTELGIVGEQEVKNSVQHRKCLIDCPSNECIGDRCCKAVLEDN